MCIYFCFFFFFKQKTAYEITEGDWSSVCSSDLTACPERLRVCRTPTHSTATATRTGRGSRSEERRVGKECPQLCRTRRSPDHSKKKYMIQERQRHHPKKHVIVEDQNRT